MVERIKIDINGPVDGWIAALAGVQDDCLIFEKDRDKLIWFTTNLTQYLVRKGNSEVVPVYGRHINDLRDFIYQINFSLVTSCEMGENLHALYDTLLNFETEPAQRFLFWNDADHLFQSNQATFEDIFECMVVAAYVNRQGISTYKENGKPYFVDQRNIFSFSNMNPEEVLPLLGREFYIASIVEEQRMDQKLDFTLIELTDFID